MAAHFGLQSRTKQAHLHASTCVCRRGASESDLWRDVEVTHPPLELTERRRRRRRRRPQLCEKGQPRLRRAVRQRLHWPEESWCWVSLSLQGQRGALFTGWRHHRSSFRLVAVLVFLLFFIFPSFRLLVLATRTTCYAQLPLLGDAAITGAFTQGRLVARQLV